MTNSFPLAGLLRLRKLQEDQSAAALSAARGRADEVRQRSRRLRETLDPSTGLRAGASNAAAASSVEHIVAIAAARASTSSMLSELEALGRSTADEEARTLAEHQENRRRALTLEKLEAGHRAAEAVERGIEEQKTLDELALRGWNATPPTELRTDRAGGRR